MENRSYVGRDFCEHWVERSAGKLTAKQSCAQSSSKAGWDGYAVAQLERCSKFVCRYAAAVCLPHRGCSVMVRRKLGMKAGSGVLNLQCSQISPSDAAGKECVVSGLHLAIRDIRPNIAGEGLGKNNARFWGLNRPFDSSGAHLLVHAGHELEMQGQHHVQQPASHSDYEQREYLSLKARCFAAARARVVRSSRSAQSRRCKCFQAKRGGTVA
ncbi:hypothetical protein SVAN01_04872 [Stagonosporopsis vannaccii]|nr:hypothetical protein SVAN01_04872 [Stagonosporopsis vannaccii]